MNVQYHDILAECRQGSKLAQNALYKKLSPTVFAICRRYMAKLEDAEDLLLESFMKIFEKLPSFRDEGSFEGWAKRITVNQCLMALRKKEAFHLSVDDAFHIASDEPDIQSKLHYEEIIEILDSLPLGYRTVFNMYVVEGYKHKEIAEHLKISINTSKSQLIQAKKKIIEAIKKKKTIAI